MGKPCNHNTTQDGCRICYLFENDPRYAKLWGEPVGAEPQRTYLINLKRRSDRLEQARHQFLTHTDFVPQIFDAVDGRALPLPEGWKDGPGAYGCSLSHRGILQQCLTDGIDCVAVFEDDVTFQKDFRTKYAEFLKAVPGDWDAIFLGGQHIEPPEATNYKGVLRGTNIHRTHSYIIRGAYLRFMFQKWSTELGHVDHIWGRYQKEWKVYAPLKWLCGQGASQSDINGRNLGAREWQPRRIKPASEQPKKCGTCNQPKDRKVR